MSVIEHLIDPRSRDLGGFSVRRLLPYSKRRTVGPFIFFDQMGPATFPPGEGMDVRPHPHIGLATITYLFEGEILHRDNLGYVQPIRPGAINWMTAGNGIVHSERTPPELRETGFDISGLQIWIALPKTHEEVDASFSHHPEETLPTTKLDGVDIRVMVGSAYGLTSPVETFSPMFYVDAQLESGATLDLPDYGERAIFPLTCDTEIDGQTIKEGNMAVLKYNCGSVSLTSPKGGRVMLLGGAALDGPRHLWWNFVSSDPERLEAAKQRWRDDAFGQVPGESERIPLPED